MRGKTITRVDNGWCDFCSKSGKIGITPTLFFAEEYEEYTSFEICAVCFTKLLNKLEPGKETKYKEIKAILERG